MGGQMGGHARTMMGDQKVQVLAVCDVDRSMREKWKTNIENNYASAKAGGTYRGCDAYNEYERIVERKDIDAVIVCTPDHWHVPISLAAVRTGKDVYVEKPMLLTVREGRLFSDTARQYGAIVQVGSQQRSNFSFRRACEMVRNGWIGKIREVQCFLGEFAPPVPLPEQPVPDGFDYDRWLGPAPWQPYNAKRVERNYGGGWRNYWDYGSRKHGDWGAHHFDITQWALGMDASGPVEFMPAKFNGGDNLQTHTYASGTVVTRIPRPVSGRDGTSYSIRFIGESGEVLVSRDECLETTPAELRKNTLGASDIRLYKSLEHHQDWLECIRTRKQPICHVEIGHRSATICALGAIAERLARPLKWDPDREEIIGDEEASRFLDRPRRAPYFI